MLEDMPVLRYLCRMDLYQYIDSFRRLQYRPMEMSNNLNIMNKN